MTIVICGFPGVGKSTLFKKIKEGIEDITILDSDSSTFDKEQFPWNYLNHIVQKYEEGIDVLLISTHIDVRKGLTSLGIPYLLVKPEINLKEEYLERYRMRGSPEAFVNLMDKSWNSFQEELPNENVFDLESGEFLGDYSIDIYKSYLNQTYFK